MLHKADIEVDFRTYVMPELRKAGADSENVKEAWYTFVAEIVEEGDLTAAQTRNWAPITEAMPVR